MLTPARVPAWRVAALFVSFGIFVVSDVSMGALARAAQEWAERRATQAAVARTTGATVAIRIPHPYYSHDLAPNVEVTTTHGPIVYAMQTNSLGFRDAIRRDVPAKGSDPRILVIGDSFVEGVGVEYASTVTGHLARRYAHDGIEVLNAGVVSYSPAIYWKKLEYLLERRSLSVDAVVVFLDMSDIQDEVASYRIDARGRVIDAPDPPFDLLHAWMSNSLTYGVVTATTQRIWPHAAWGGCRVPGAGDYSCRVGWTLSRSAMNNFGRLGLERADAHMSGLAALLRARGIPVTLVVYPWPQHLLWNDRSSLQVRYWRQWAGRERVAFIELFTPFFAEVDAVGAKAAISRYFIEGDMHWNAAGHGLVAEYVARHVVPPVRVTGPRVSVKAGRNRPVVSH